MSLGRICGIFSQMNVQIMILRRENGTVVIQRLFQLINRPLKRCYVKDVALFSLGRSFL